MTINGPRYPSVERLREATEHLTGTMTFGMAGTWKDKVLQLMALLGADVPVPRVYNTLRDAQAASIAGAVVWGRKARHSHGSDIATNPRSRRWKSSDFWVEQVQNIKNEWRVHVFNYARRGEGKDYRVIAGGRKARVEDSGYLFNCRHDKPGRYCSICFFVRSRRNGWTIVRDEKPSDVVRKIAKRAVAVLGMQYGAVDILEREDGSVVVLEVNFAPAMDDRTRRAYVRALEYVWGG